MKSAASRASAWRTNPAARSSPCGSCRRGQGPDRVSQHAGRPVKQSGAQLDRRSDRDHGTWRPSRAGFPRTRLTTNGDTTCWGMEAHGQGVYGTADARHPVRWFDRIICGSDATRLRPTPEEVKAARNEQGRIFRPSIDTRDCRTDAGVERYDGAWGRSWAAAPDEPPADTGVRVEELNELERGAVELVLDPPVDGAHVVAGPEVSVGFLAPKTAGFRWVISIQRKR
jgi:hypothetical protein